MQLMEHQEEAVNKLANGKILWGNVGSGKSLVALAYYKKNEAPKDVYVITTAKKRDSLEWMKDSAALGLGRMVDGEVVDIVKVDSWNNIGKYVDIENAFFIFDEQRVVGSGEWVKSFLKITKKNNWILLSATPGDTWLDYIPVFIANNLYKNATEFKREHCVYAPYSRYPRLIRYLDVRTLEKYRNMLLVEMPYINHTVRVMEDVEVDYDKDVFNRIYKDRWNVYEQRPIKDIAELFKLMRRVVNRDASRLAAIRELLKKHDRLIIFYNFNYELDILRTLWDVVPVREWNGHRKDSIPDTDKWVYLVQYVAGAEGWNCISTDTMVFYSLTYSWKNLEQAMGRIDRLNTPYTTLYYYVLRSLSIIDRAIGNALNNKELFNERSWAARNLE